MTASLAQCYRFDRFVIDARSACLRRDGASVPLRPKSFDVLLYLVRNRGRLITKDELFENVWADVVVGDNSLVQCIKEVRKAIGDDRQTMVETVAKRGYVFRPAVVEGDAEQPSGAAAGPIEIAPAARTAPPLGRRAAIFAGGIAAALVMAGGLWWALSPQAVPLPPVEASTAEHETEKRLSIAVLPFGILGNPPTTISRSASATMSPPRLPAFPIWPSHRRRSSRHSATPRPVPRISSAS